MQNDYFNMVAVNILAIYQWLFAAIDLNAFTLGIYHETLSLEWKVKITIKVNGEIFHFSLFILGKKFYDW